VTLLDVLADRPEPCPASGIPDNCAIAAAHGRYLIHLDDDNAVDTRLIEYCHTLPLDAPAVVWPQTDFVDASTMAPLAGNATDCRVLLLIKKCCQLEPTGLMRILAQWPYHWGCAWIVSTAELRARGGHELEHAGDHNTDTRLGSRLAFGGLASYFACDPRARIRHLGETWHMRARRENPKLLRRLEPHIDRPPKIANGGAAFWTSAWVRSAYSLRAQFDATN